MSDQDQELRRRLDRALAEQQKKPRDLDLKVEIEKPTQFRWCPICGSYH